MIMQEFRETKILHDMNPILKKHFSNFKQRFEIIPPNNLSEREAILFESKAFEKFVNNIIFSLDNPDTFTGDIDLLNFISIGGGHDTGIDGLGIRVNDIFVRNIDDVKVILKEKNKKIEYDFIFVQSKMQTNFDTAEFNTFALGVEHFLSKNPILPENDRLKEHRELKDFLDTDEVNEKIKRNPNLILYYVSAGNPPTDQHFLGTKTIIEKKLQESSYYFNSIEIRIIDGNTLIGFCDELENNYSVKINILDTLPLLVGNNDEIKKAHVFTCTAKEYLKILTKDDGTLRKHLFNDNVRDYLGNKEGSVNSEIEKSIAENPEMFLLCNNGITIVCNDFNPIKDKLVQIDNPQIVNGCQTSNTIFRQKDSRNIEDVKLLVRLICTENQNISNKIVRGTNKQNQVLDEAFEATRPFHQDKLEPFFLAIDSEPRLFYERRSKQYSDSNIKKTQIVNLRILTQSFVAMFLNAPHDSYRHEKIILENYAGEGQGRKIYRNEHSEYPYYVSAATWYMFERNLAQDTPENKELRKYRGHLYYIFRKLMAEEMPSINKGHKIEKYCKKILGCLSEVSFKDYFNTTVSLFERARVEWIRNGKSQHGIKDNKEFTEFLTTFLKTQNSAVVEDNTNLNEILVHSGTLLKLIHRLDGKWYGFIECEDLWENAYFDSRGFKGDKDTLKVGCKLKFKIFSYSQDRITATDVNFSDS